MSDEFLDKYPMLRRHFPILWYLLLLSREIDTRRGEGDQESDSPLAGDYMTFQTTSRSVTRYDHTLRPDPTTVSTSRTHPTVGYLSTVSL